MGRRARQMHLDAASAITKIRISSVPRKKNYGHRHPANLDAAIAGARRRGPQPAAEAPRIAKLRELAQDLAEDLLAEFHVGASRPRTRGIINDRATMTGRLGRGCIARSRDEVVQRLGGVARTRRANMQDGGAHRLQHRPRARDRRSMIGRVEAIDLASHKTLWVQRRRAPHSSAILGTAGGLIFEGSRDRWFRASDERTGKVPQPADAQHRNKVAGECATVPQRVEGSNSSAEQRCCFGIS